MNDLETTQPEGAPRAMNCKPGDFAIVIGSRTKHGEQYIGRIIEIIKEAPATSFILPDGKWHEPAGTGEWVVKSIRGDFTVWLEGNIRTRQTPFAVGHDSCFMPLTKEQAEALHKQVSV